MQYHVGISIVAVATLCALLLGPDAQAQGAASSRKWQPVATNTTFETGDTWVTNGQRFRLYGVQSCLRGTAYTDPMATSTTAGTPRFVCWSRLSGHGHPFVHRSV